MNTRKLIIAATLGVGISLSPLAFATDASKPSTGEAIENYVSDTMLTTKTKAAIVAEKELSALDISVETTNGVVILSGPVSSMAESDLAEKTVRAIEGVKDVRNELRIEPVAAK